MSTIQTDWAQETLRLAERWSADIGEKFNAEVNRLITSGAIDTLAGCSRGLLFGVALENLADNYLRGERKTKAYLNLKRF
jgi:hypothetical protein